METHRHGDDVASNPVAPGSVNDEIVIRRLIAADSDRYMQFRVAALARTPTASTSTPEEERDRPSSWAVARFGGDDNPHDLVLGAFDGVELVGVAGLTIGDQRQARHKALLFGMAVAGRIGGRGVGRLLVNALLERAKSTGLVKQVVLTVSEGNGPAEALYRRCGFVAFGREPRAVIVSGVPIAKVHMICILDGFTEAALKEQIA